MKRFAWVLAFLLSIVTASLVTTGESAAVQAARGLGKKGSPAGPLALCQTTYCQKTSDCYAACGGLGSCYCYTNQHHCVPF
jgi:hypothetical protein